MIDGVAITSAAGTQGMLGALGDSRNSQFSCIVAQPGKAPLTPPSEFAAAVAGVVALSAANDPARPFQYLPLAGVRAPAESDRFTTAERNLELLDGIATSRVASGGEVQIERLVTTYQTNAAGAVDTSYRDAMSVFTLMYLRYSFRNLIGTRFPRHKLADNGTRFSAGQAIVTPMTAKAVAVGWFREMESLGLVENFEQFKRDLVVERDQSDRNRLNFLLPPDLINGLIVTAANIQFRL
jgi:phage tail sheath gpL-like